MRLGVVLEGAPGVAALQSLAAQACAAESVGLDFAWLAPEAGAAALLAASSVAASTTVLRLVARVAVGAHPLEIAEAAVVAENCSAGRLGLVLESVGRDRDLLAETTDAILAATSPRPFRHHGARWRIPANLPENEDHEARLAVTPYCVQPELPIWLAGPESDGVARERGLSHVSGAGESAEDAARAWAATERALGPGARRLRRPALRAVHADADGDLDDAALVAMLRAEQRLWDVDIAVLRLPAALDDRARARAMRRVASRVRPRVVLDALPPGLEAYWDEALA
jgi:hypothetical protein